MKYKDDGDKFTYELDEKLLRYDWWGSKYGVVIADT